MLAAEDVLEGTDAKGFPIVSSDEKRVLMGYIGRTELRYIIGELPLWDSVSVALPHAVCRCVDKAKKAQSISRDTLCLFASGDGERDEVEFAGIATGSGIDLDDDISLEIIETTSTHDVLKLWPWVNQVSAPKSKWGEAYWSYPQTPLTVSPQLPLEIVMQLFKRMG